MKERHQNNQLSHEVHEIVRPFASGSRQAPDPFDLYLDEKGFYRKHTARDSSSLFRAISEQIYGIQNYHERVRSEIIDFMSKNYRLFERSIKMLSENYDDYLMDLSKLKSHGTHLELRAAGLLYKANIIIFEPFMPGKYLFKFRKNFTRVIRVFFTAPSHFDTIFTKNYIEKAAFCQAIVYEILYEKVFKLPDVKYAIERMLYDPNGDNMEFNGIEGEDSAVTEDGREFLFDKADGTNCVLGDYKLCHFHNKSGFDAEIEKVKTVDETLINKSLIELDALPKSIKKDYFLYDSKVSCVRQLLNASIAPFPYKVAKALDPSIYRNIEFDSWADFRREMKFKNWFYRGNQLLVGSKCLLRRFDNRESYNICVIKDISKDNYECLVNIDATGEEIFVPYASLKPLMSVNYGKLEESYNVHNLSHRFFTYNDKNQHLSVKSYKRQETTYKRGKYSSSVKCDIEIDRIGEKFEPFLREIITTPMMFNRNAVIKTEPNSGSDLKKPITILKGMANNNNNNETKSFLTPENNLSFLQDAVGSSENSELTKILQNHGGNKTPILGKPIGINDLSKINYSASKSEMIDGSDLPGDMATLRFFYNTGIDAFKSNKTVGHIASQFSHLNSTDNGISTPTMTQTNIKQMVQDFGKLKTDDNNNTSSTLTPTSVKADPSVASTISHRESGHYHNDFQYRRGYNNNNNKRRQYHPNNSGRGFYNSGHFYNANRNTGLQHNRHGGSYHVSDYGRQNNHHDNALKGSTSPTSFASQQSASLDTGSNTETTVPVPTHQQDSTQWNTLAHQQQQYQYACQTEYDQNNYYVQQPMPYYYPQPSSVPTTPQLMIPGPEMNSYMYNPSSAPIDGSGTQLVEPVFQPYIQPYFYSAPIQPPPMGYFYYPPPTPMAYGTTGTTTATSPQIPPMGNVMSTMSNVPQ